MTNILMVTFLIMLAEIPGVDPVPPTEDPFKAPAIQLNQEAPRLEYHVVIHSILDGEDKLAEATKTLLQIQAQYRVAQQMTGRANAEKQRIQYAFDHPIYYPPSQDADGRWSPGYTVRNPEATEENIRKTQGQLYAAELAMARWQPQLAPAQQKVDELKAQLDELTKAKVTAKMDTPQPPKPWTPSKIILMKDGTKIEATQVMKDNKTLLVKEKDGEIHKYDIDLVESGF